MIPENLVAARDGRTDGRTDEDDPAMAMVIQSGNANSNGEAVIKQEKRESASLRRSWRCWKRRWVGNGVENLLGTRERG